MADAKCTIGHEFTLRDFDPEPEVIAALSWCPTMVAKPEHAGLVMECGALVLWLRAVSFQKKVKGHRFRVKQLDLFYDTPLDKPETE